MLKSLCLWETGDSFGEVPGTWRPHLVKELSPNTGGSRTTWAKSVFLSILRSSDFNFNIDGKFSKWRKFNLASYSVSGIPFFRSLLIIFVPRNFLLSKNTCRCFFLGYLSKLVETTLGNFKKQSHYVVAIAKFPCRKWAYCFVHLTCPLT